jgi:hypothetical protein
MMKEEQTRREHTTARGNKEDGETPAWRETKLKMNRPQNINTKCKLMYTT